MCTSRRDRPRLLTVLIALGSAAALAGCADYINHRDQVTLGAGDAQKFNQAVHVIHPSPPWSRNTNIDMDGQRVERVIDRYGTPPAQPVPTPPDVSGTTGSR